MVVAYNMPAENAVDFYALRSRYSVRCLCQSASHSNNLESYSTARSCGNARNVRRNMRCESDGCVLQRARGKRSGFLRFRKPQISLEGSHYRNCLSPSLLSLQFNSTKKSMLRINLAYFFHL
jgi:hypothetical protein